MRQLFDKKDTYALRGVAMLMIVFHHIWTTILHTDGDVAPFLSEYIFVPWGYYGTCLFFFLSGYGLFLSMNHATKLNPSYLGKRIKNLIEPFLFCFILFICAFAFFEPSKINIGLLKDLFTLTIPTTTTWFYKVIFVLYIYTFLSFKLNILNKTRVLMTYLICLIYIYFAHKYLPSFWYISILGYPLGQTFAITSSRNKLYIWTTVLLFIASVLTVVLKTAYFIPLSLLFSLISLGIVKYVSIKCRFLDFIGTESLCFYLFQMLMLYIGLRIGISNDWILYGLFVFISTYILTIIFKLSITAINRI